MALAAPATEELARCRWAALFGDAVEDSEIHLVELPPNEQRSRGAELLHMLQAPTPDHELGLAFAASSTAAAAARGGDHDFEATALEPQLTIRRTFIELIPPPGYCTGQRKRALTDSAAILKGSSVTMGNTSPEFMSEDSTSASDVEQGANSPGVTRVKSGGSAGSEAPTGPNPRHPCGSSSGEAWLNSASSDHTAPIGSLAVKAEATSQTVSPPSSIGVASWQPSRSEHLPSSTGVASWQQSPPEHPPYWWMPMSYPGPFVKSWAPLSQPEQPLCWPRSKCAAAGASSGRWDGGSAECEESTIQRTNTVMLRNAYSGGGSECSERASQPMTTVKIRRLPRGRSSALPESSLQPTSTVMLRNAHSGRSSALPESSFQPTSTVMLQNAYSGGGSECSESTSLPKTTVMIRNVPSGGGSESSESTSQPKTTVMLRNLPSGYTWADALELLEDEGFAGSFDFVYLPIDFGSGCCLGYAFVNFISAGDARRCWKVFEGFREWGRASDKVCEVTWGDPHQGLEAHVHRYRNSPVMHETVPLEWKPIIFKGGVQVPFPKPTKAIRAPKIRSRGATRPAPPWTN